MVKLLKKTLKHQFLNFYTNIFEQKFEKINKKSKLYLYKSLKQNLEMENYLNCKSFEKRSNITKMRISYHNLVIEKGRHLKIPREKRLCTSCNTMEDEAHFILYCKKIAKLRDNFIGNVIKHMPDFMSWQENEKIKYLLCPSTSKEVESLGSYFKQALELRTGDS